MVSLRDLFGVAVGYSDHTQGIEVALAAAALGATVIEKHITLDRSLPGPDHMSSLEPDEFRRLVEGVRKIEVALGDGHKERTASELPNMLAARKSLVAARQIAKGEVFTDANIAAKRPGNGISPMRIDEIIGQTAVRSFSPDEPIEL
jgi:N,N'-diacetyllegionaminate synthase